MRVYNISELAGLDLRYVLRSCCLWNGGTGNVERECVDKWERLLRFI